MRTEIQILLAVIAVGLLSMAVYRVIPRKEGTDHTSRRGSFVLGTWVRDWFYWTLRPVEKLSLAWRLAPEIFNALGLLLGFAAMVAYAKGNLPAGGCLVLLGGLADVFDGIVARARNLVSPFGAFLDSTLDRFNEVAVFVGLAVYYRDLVPVVVILVALSGSLMVSYTRARGEGLGISCKLGVMQRAERMLLLGIASILDPTIASAVGRDEGFPLLVALTLIAAGSMGTAIFRTFWISRELKKG